MRCPYCGSTRTRKAGWPTTNKRECHDCAGVFEWDGSSSPSVEFQPLDNPMSRAELDKIINDMWGANKFVSPEERKKTIC